MQAEPVPQTESPAPINVLVAEALALIAEVGPEEARRTLAAQLLETRPKGSELTLVAGFLNGVFRDAMVDLKEQIPGATCDFCLKRQEETVFMVQGPSFIICDQCVRTCLGALAKHNCRRGLRALPWIGRFFQRTVRAAYTSKIAFVFYAPKARQVALCGDFNDWSPEATPMTRRNGGRWEATLALRRGRYQYKFVVDGEWTHDPMAAENVPNEEGSLNSVVEVRRWRAARGWRWLPGGRGPEQAG